MLTQEGQEKLADYVEGFLALPTDATPPIGAVLLGDEHHRPEVLKHLENQGFHVFAVSKTNPLEQQFRELVQAITNGSSLCVSFEDDVLFTGKATNFLEGFSRDMAAVHLPGNVDPVVVHPASFGARLLLVLPANLYDSGLPFQQIITSACRLSKNKTPLI